MFLQARELTRPPRLRPNAFGLPFGICGLALCWSASRTVAGVPAWPSETLWVMAGLSWLATATVYGTAVVRTKRVREEINDPTFGPFLALAFIVPMMLGGALAERAALLGKILFFVGLVFTVAFGAYLAGGWLRPGDRLDYWHPGYLLPTVAAGLIASADAASLGYAGLARFMFGYGTICWLIFGTVVLVRLVGRPGLATPLQPTLAILVAPPVVAGNAWFAANGNKADSVALLLAGFAVLMVLMQLRLIPVFRSVPFGPGSWAFSFSYAAAFACALRWLEAEHVAHQRLLAYLLLAVVTSSITSLAGATIQRLARGTYLDAVAGSVRTP